MRAPERTVEAPPGLGLTPGSWGGGEGGCPGGYLESIAKSFSASTPGLTWADFSASAPCPSWAIVGTCINGHRFAKELYDGREWCPVCGADWSAVHQRRFARWLPKAQQIGAMGYLVITFPPRARERLRTKAGLSWVGKGIRAILQDYGISRGLRRWHWFGEQAGVWNPHLNVLLDGGYRSRRSLRKIRREIAHLVGERDVVINYQYAKAGEVGEMVHWLKYITRATFLQESWDERMAAELYNFRNTWSWGKWDGQPAWSLEDLGGDEGLDAGPVRKLESGICPECGEALDWARPIDRRRLDVELDKQELGAGYYRLRDLPGPGPPRESPLVQEAIRLGARVIRYTRADWHKRLLARATQQRGHHVRGSAKQGAAD